MYEVIVNTGRVMVGYPDARPVYAILDVNGRSEWKTKRIAEKHAREYKSNHMRDAWVQEV